MNIELFFDYLVVGLTTGILYAIVAIGFNIIYNTTGIINFAQGEFLVLGAMVAVTVSEFLPVGVAVACGIAVAAGYGMLVETVFVRRVSHFSALRAVSIGIIVALLLKTVLELHELPPGVDYLICLAAGIPAGFCLEILFRKHMKEQTVLGLIILTIAVSILTREIMLHIWDEKVHALPNFTGNEVSLTIGSVSFSPQRLWVMGVCGILVVGLYLFFKYTRYGKAMRACSLDKTAASLCGINTRVMITISFVLSAAIAALAGAVICPLTQTQYNMGTSFAIKGFTVAILGGLGKSFAAVAGGLILGILEAFSVSLLPNAFKDVVAMSLLLIILTSMPSGLFGSRQESRLKDF
ncbi:MAG: branched-chain amino acid ABC transporter permease [Spirochaetaceae bacterium]|nr:MAG: branched-chain amino acid ABC transporter permease [Spirochaetaceae bacterium]